jgi:hypothetical protein
LVSASVTICGSMAVFAAAADSVWTMMNPTGRVYSNELVRIKVSVPADVAADVYVVTEDGKEVPWQIEENEGGKCVWVSADLGRDETRVYELSRGKPARFPPRVRVESGSGSWAADSASPRAVQGKQWILDNGLVAVRLPAEQSVALAGPVAQVRLPDGRWAGRSVWRTGRKLKSFQSTLIGDGTVFGKVRLRYEFEGMGGLFGETPSFYQADIALGPGRRHAVVEESFAMGRGEYWEFDAAEGWAPRQALAIPHFGGFDRPMIADDEGKPYPFPPQSLRFGQTRMGDTLLNLVPRWNQAYDDGWFFMAHDGENAVGAMVCRAGRWLWPYDGMIEIKVKRSADYAGFRCPTWRGKRYWFLVAGPRDAWGSQPACEEYVLRHSYETLDKIHQEYILDWPGLQPPPDANGQPTVPPEEFCSGAGRFGRRSKAFFGWGPGSGSVSGGDHPIVSLIRAQVYLDPDTFGDYWLYFSPENPNFASSWIGGAYEAMQRAAAYPGVRDHPSFKVLGEMLRMKTREEAYHSVTLPSGAGQECFGYMSRGSWVHHAKVCRELGFDAGTEPWMEAAARFIFRASHPMADGGRRSHPGGDTHPPGPDVFDGLGWFGLKEDAATLRTEELAGFGAIFHNNPATPRETYLAFKSGPNRGHFHGDQLSFHYCAYARPLAVDHHCSYAPHAGQEHMHNRVAFHTEKLPWANMDGYERLIALKTSPEADVAIGQVESERLRITEKFPPQRWDTDLPQEVFDTPLKYRRTIVFLKHAGQDCFVIRDQYAGPDVYATFCLHVLGERCERKDNVFDFDGMQLHVIKPADFTMSRHDWEHEYGGKETTKGLRATVKGPRSEFITVLMPRPVRRSDVASFVLKKVLRKGISREKGAKPEIVDIDLNVRVALKDGKPASRHAYVTPGPAEVKHIYAFLGTVETGDTVNSLRLSVEGVRGRFQYERVKFDCSVRLDRNGDVCSGSYTGRLWDAAILKAAQKGQETPPREHGGEVSGVLEKNAFAPVPLFDEAWRAPPIEARPDGVKIGTAEVRFSGAITDEDATAYVTVGVEQRLLTVTGKDIDLDRSQGDIGLFVPDAGYPFGDIPDWLIRQRTVLPAWYKSAWPPAAHSQPTKVPQHWRAPDAR